MACRIGITTDLVERQQYWMSQYPFTFRNWQVTGPYFTRTAAQEQENAEAFRLGCTAHPGGAGPEVAYWYVYYFEY